MQSIKWGCPSCAVPEFEKFPVPQFMWSGPSCTQSWMHDLQPRARGWELELGIFQRKPRPKVKSRDPPLPQSNYEKNSRHYYRVGITVLRCHDLRCVSPVVGSTVEAGIAGLVHSLQVQGLKDMIFDMYLIKEDKKKLGQRSRSHHRSEGNGSSSHLTTSGYLVTS